MTTIAWDGKTLAADRQSTSGNLRYATSKIRKIKGSLYAAAGTAAIINEAFAWIEAGAIPIDMPLAQRDKDDGCYILRVDPDEKIYLYERSPYPSEIKQVQFAIGSGRDLALAAMYMGATAEQAIVIAHHFDVTTGLGVDILTLDNICE